VDVEEQDAVRRLKRGEIAGLEFLVQRYQARAVRAAYLVTRDRGVATELVQSAFVRAYERIGTFDDGRPFGPWFLKLVLNDAIKAAARRAREVVLETSDVAGPPADPEPTPEARLERAETAEEVWSALARLPPAQRAAVVQRYYLELSEAEMARASACRPSTIKWRLHAARKRLRSLLRPAVGDMEGIR
jgi:RNA polymerase sigma-70 factor (ECF subfamily)